MNKSAILITGGAGFIGSNFIHYFMNIYPEVPIVNIDKLTYAGSLQNLKGIDSNANYHFVEGDIADEQVVQQVFQNFDIHGVIHFAAESHVDRSITDARSFVDTNVVGTLNLLQAARNDWGGKRELEGRRFHHISTDEVYGSLGEEGIFTEETPYDPRNPYSASKAGANLMVKSFGYTYGMNIILSSSSNNYGPRQHEEKLLPTIIEQALNGKEIPIYGDGKNVRDWLYVEDHCRAIDTVYHFGKSQETYNIGGRNERTNLEITNQICDILNDLRPDLLSKYELGEFQDLITFVEDRKGHDLRYAIDDSKLRNELQWEPKQSLENGLKQTIEWYIRKWESITKMNH